jgi:hypothetical protein
LVLVVKGMEGGGADHLTILAAVLSMGRSALLCCLAYNRTAFTFTTATTNSNSNSSNKNNDNDIRVNNNIRNSAT